MKSPGEIRVRLAVPRDIETILALDRGIDNLPHWTAADYSASIAGAASQPRRCLFVAESEGRIEGLAVGMMQIIAEDCWAELETVGVAPGMQRRGLGRQLCRAVIGWTRSQGAAHIDLEVRSRGGAAIALYRELGFEIAGTRRAYYRAPADDAVLMRLDLKRESGQPASIAEPAG